MRRTILKPTPQQLKWQKAGFGMFCHFGINTFNGKEWSDGTLPAESFAPSDLDARQWVGIAQEAGMRYLVLTAKHHDGFCLWPTDTTSYSVRRSPWRGGKGDVVEEMASACRDAGLPLGLYLSPWDRHEPCYPDAKAYDEFYLRQLTELCSRYGRLFELWFDGAGSEGRVYDWHRIMSTVESLQPDAMIFNMGRPTIRWVGNEDGVAEDPVQYVMTSARASAFTEENQGTLLNHEAYCPPECDVAIRRNWFWQPDDLHTLKSREELLGIWYRSVGLGANLLLNLPPDRRGRLDDQDVARLIETTSEIGKRFGKPVSGRLEIPHGSQCLRAHFQSELTLDHVELVEDVHEGQRISGFIIRDDRGRELSRGQSVGVRRIEAVAATHTQFLDIQLEGGTNLEAVRVYHAGASIRPGIGAKLNYEMWKEKADLPA